MRLIRIHRFCHLCEKESNMRIVYSSLSPATGIRYSEEEDNEKKYDRYYAVICLKCRGMLLYGSDENNPIESEQTGGQNDFIYNNFVNAQLLYPNPVWLRLQKNLPNNIAEKYEFAMKIKSISPESFAIAMRVILEETCSYFSIQKKRSASKRFELLFKTQTLPVEFKKLIEMMRKFGNKAAHELKVDKRDVPNMEKYLNLVLEYLFVLRPNLTKNPETKAELLNKTIKT